MLLSGLPLLCGCMYACLHHTSILSTEDNGCVAITRSVFDIFEAKNIFDDLELFIISEFQSQVLFISSFLDP